MATSDPATRGICGVNEKFVQPLSSTAAAAAPTARERMRERNVPPRIGLRRI
jgi:hypothetical protein